MNNKKETIVAVVVTYNRKQLLLECLESLRKQTFPVEAIYVVDNASTDGTPEYLKEKGYIQQLPTANLKEPWCRSSKIKCKFNEIIVYYSRMHENLGGAGGFHEGVKSAYQLGYDWLWPMDDDSLPLANSLELLLDGASVFQNKPVVIVPVQQRDKDTICGSGFWRHRGITTSQEDLLRGNPFIEVDMFSFVCPLIKKQVIELVGFPLKEFFIFWDDAEYSLRIKSKGIPIVVNNKSRVRHKIRENDLKTTRERRIQYANEAEWKTYYNFRNWLYFLIFIKKDFIGVYWYCVAYIKRHIAVLIYSKNALSKSKILVAAVKDALSKRLGKRTFTS